LKKWDIQLCYKNYESLKTGIYNFVSLNF